MTKKKKISCGVKSIVLTDEQMVDEINELLAKSDYNYNFNKLANDLLARGIDSFKVDDKPTEEVKPKEEEWEDRSESVQVCEFMEELVGLMKENTVYLSIIKSIVSSLFNGKVAELDGQPLPKRTFERLSRAARTDSLRRIWRDTKSERLRNSEISDGSQSNYFRFEIHAVQFETRRFRR